jgi:hypothetical protein
MAERMTDGELQAVLAGAVGVAWVMGHRLSDKDLADVIGTWLRTVNQERGDSPKTKQWCYQTLNVMVESMRRKPDPPARKLGEFRDDQTWVAACDPQDFHEAVGVLERAGVDDVLVQFGEQGV